MNESTYPRSRNVLAALAYPLGAVSALACLWRGRADAFVRFHACQSILLTVAAVAAVLGVRWVPLVGAPLAIAAVVAAVVAALAVALGAYRGRWTALPLLGDLAADRLPPETRP